MSTDSFKVRWLRSLLALLPHLPLELPLLPLTFPLLPFQQPLPPQIPETLVQEQLPTLRPFCPFVQRFLAILVQLFQLYGDRDLDPETLVLFFGLGRAFLDLDELGADTVALQFGFESAIVGLDPGERPMADPEE